MQTVVTGGAGFIGSHLVRGLIERGHCVRVVDNFSTGSRGNLTSLPDVELVEGDIRDLEMLKAAFTGVDVVFHEAALPSVPRSVAAPATSNEVNVTGTLNALIAARDAGVRRLVYASSSSVYGNTEVLPKQEEMPTMPLSPYAVSKLAGEQYCRVFTHIYGLETVSLRYFNVFGPRQDPTSQYSAAIPKFIAAASQGEAPTVFGDGTQSRDFTFVGNVVAANLCAAEAKGAAGHVFNVATGSRITLNEVVEQIGRALGRPVQPHYAPERSGDVKHSQADISRARDVLGYEPCASFEDGLKRTVEWLLSR